MLPAGDRLTQFAEVRQAGFVENDDLAVDNGTLDAKLPSRLSQVTVLRRPVKTAPRLERVAINWPHIRQL